MSTHADNKGSRKKASKSAPPEFRYINYDLSKDQQREAESFDFDVEFPPGTEYDLAYQGYKYSISPDLRNQCFIASLTCKIAGDGFENACLVGRGATPIDARNSLLYRHLYLAQGDWSLFDQDVDKRPGKMW